MGAIANEQADLAAVRNRCESDRDRSHAARRRPARSQTGNPISLYRVLGGQVTVVIFYRGLWCPYCNIALKTYQTMVPQLARRNARFVAISPQVAYGSLSMAERNRLTFKVLADPGNQLAEAVGILTATSDEERTVQLQLGVDLTRLNADGTVALPMPTTIIVDADHVVRWVDVHPDYTNRSEPYQILGALDAFLAR